MEKGINDIFSKSEFEAVLHRCTFRAFPQAISNDSGNSFVNVSHFPLARSRDFVIPRHPYVSKLARENGCLRLEYSWPA